MGSGGSVGRVPAEGQRGTSRVSATRAGGSPVPRPVPLFSLKPVPSPHLVGLSRGAPQSVTGGRWEEDSQVRRESPVLFPDSEFLSYNLMLNSGKSFATKKVNILTLVLSEKKILNETKTITPRPPPPPLQVKWSVP